jgi:hypothetical protein
VLGVRLSLLECLGLLLLMTASGHIPIGDDPSADAADSARTLTGLRNQSHNADVRPHADPSVAAADSARTLTGLRNQSHNASSSNTHTRDLCQLADSEQAKAKHGRDILFVGDSLVRNPFLLIAFDYLRSNSIWTEGEYLQFQTECWAMKNSLYANSVFHRGPCSFANLCGGRVRLHYIQSYGVGKADHLADLQDTIKNNHELPKVFDYVVFSLGGHYILNSNTSTHQYRSDIIAYADYFETISSEHVVFMTMQPIIESRVWDEYKTFATLAAVETLVEVSTKAFHKRPKISVLDVYTPNLSNLKSPNLWQDWIHFNPALLRQQAQQIVDAILSATKPRRHPAT